MGVKTDVDRPQAEEIVAGIDFSPKEAEAIVGYREKNGPYKSWRDLTKVIDSSRVEAKKNHIAVE